MKLPRLIIFLLFCSVLIAPGLVGLFGINGVSDQLKSFANACDAQGECKPVCNQAGQCFTVKDFEFKNYWFFTKIKAQVKLLEQDGQKQESDLVLNVHSTMSHGPVMFSDGRVQFGLFANAGYVVLHPQHETQSIDTFRVDFADKTDFSGHMQGRIFSQDQRFDLVQQRGSTKKTHVVKLAPMVGNYSASKDMASAIFSLNQGPVEVVDEIQNTVLSIESVLLEARNDGALSEQTWDSRFLIENLSVGSGLGAGGVDKFLLDAHSQIAQGKVDSDFSLTASGIRTPGSIIPFDTLAFEINSKGLDAAALEAAQIEAQKLQGSQVSPQALLSHVGLVTQAFSGAKLQKTLQAGTASDKKSQVDSTLTLQLAELSGAAQSPMMILQTLEAALSLKVHRQLLANPMVSPVINQLKAQNYVKILGEQYYLEAEFAQGQLQIFGQPVAMETLMGLAMNARGQQQPQSRSPSQPDLQPQVKEVPPSVLEDRLRRKLSRSEQLKIRKSRHGGMIRFKTDSGKVGYTDDPSKLPADATVF